MNTPCLRCGGTIPTTDPRAKFCCSPCRTAYWHAQRAAATQREREAVALLQALAASAS